MTKGQILQRIWDELSNERKKRIQDRTDELEAEYLEQRAHLNRKMINFYQIVNHLVGSEEWQGQ